MKYFVQVDGERSEVSVDGDDITIDGQTVRARLDLMEGIPVALVGIDDAVHRVLISPAERKGEWILTVQGYRIPVEAIDERTRVIREMSAGSAKPAGPTPLRAPMPGLIVRVAVKDGDTVKAGQGLVVMEAMKMENELRAPAAGVVRKVLVAPGSAVEKGAMLLEMEA